MARGDEDGGDIAEECDVLPGLTHYDVYTGEPVARVMRESLDWYRAHIPLA